MCNVSSELACAGSTSYAALHFIVGHISLSYSPAAGLDPSSCAVDWQRMCLFMHCESIHPPAVTFDQHDVGCTWSMARGLSHRLSQLLQGRGVASVSRGECKLQTCPRSKDSAGVLRLAAVGVSLVNGIKLTPAHTLAPSLLLECAVPLMALPNLAEGCSGCRSMGGRG